MVGGAIRSKLIHRMSYRASVLHQLWTTSGEENTAREFSVLTTPSLLSRGTRGKEEKSKPAPLNTIRVRHPRRTLSESRVLFGAGIFCGVEVEGVCGAVAGDLDDDGIGGGLGKMVDAAGFGVDAAWGKGL